LLIAEVQKGGETSRGGHDHVPTVPAVSPIRSPAWNELFSSKAAGAITASTGFDENADLINEHGTPKL